MRRAQRKPSRAALAVPRSLEVGPQGKLQDPWEVLLAGDDSEIRCSLRQTGITELHPIEEVEGFGAKLNINRPIPIDGEGFIRGGVPIRDARSA